MLTELTYNKLKENLYNTVSYYAMQDYKRVNKNYIPYTKTGTHRIIKSYSLTDNTNEAREYYKIMFNSTNETLTHDQEEQIKAYLLRIKLTTDILI